MGNDFKLTLLDYILQLGVSRTICNRLNAYCFDDVSKWHFDTCQSVIVLTRHVGYGAINYVGSWYSQRCSVRQIWAFETTKRIGTARKTIYRSKNLLSSIKYSFWLLNKLINNSIIRFLVLDLSMTNGSKNFHRVVLAGKNRTQNWILSGKGFIKLFIYTNFVNDYLFIGRALISLKNVLMEWMRVALFVCLEKI